MLLIGNYSISIVPQADSHYLSFLPNERHSVVNPNPGFFSLFDINLIELESVHPIHQT